MVETIRRLTDRTPLMTSILFVAALLPRLWPPLGTFINVDAAAQWIVRTKGFLGGLAELHWDRLVQAVHPGVTMLWLTSAAEGFVQLTHAERLFADPIVGYITILKIPLIVATSLLAALCYPLLRRVASKSTALLVTVLFMFDPLYLAFSRYFHLDALLTVLFFLALLTWWRALRTAKWHWPALAGGLMAAAALTRINILPVLAAVVVLGLWFNRSIGRAAWRRLGLAAAGFGVSLILLWPPVALAPRTVVSSFRHGVQLGLTQHETPANVDRQPAVRAMLYPLFLGTRTYPLVVVFALIGLGFCFRRGDDEAPLVRYAAASGLMFLLSMMVATKKIDRYALPALGPMIMTAVFGWRRTYHVVRQTWQRPLAIAIGVIAAANIIIVLSLAPYYQTYQSSIGRALIRTGLRTSAAFSPSWGEGLYHAVRYLQRTHHTMPITASWYPQVTCLYATPAGWSGYPFSPRPSRTCPPQIRSLKDARQADYILLSRSQLAQRVYPALLDDINRLGWRPEQVITLNGQPYVWIYRNAGGLRANYTQEE